MSLYFLWLIVLLSKSLHSSTSSLPTFISTIDETQPEDIDPLRATPLSTSLSLDLDWISRRVDAEVVLSKACLELWREVALPFSVLCRLQTL